MGKPDWALATAGACIVILGLTPQAANGAPAVQTAPPCAMAGPAQIAGTMPVPAPTLGNVVVVPETLGASDVTNVTIMLGAGATAGGTDVAQTGNSATVTFPAIAGAPPGTPRAAARVVTVSGPACTTATVLVLRAGGALATLARDEAQTITATIPQTLGAVTFAVQRDTIWPLTVAYASSAEKTAYRFEATAAVNSTGANALTIVPGSTKVALMQGSTKLLEAPFTPGALQFSASPCDFLSLVASSLAASPWKTALGGTGFSLEGIDTTCTASSQVATMALKGTISNGLLSATPIRIAASFTPSDASGSAGADFAITDPIVTGNLSLANVKLNLVRTGGDTSFVVNGQIVLGSGAKSSVQSGVISLRFTPQGLELVPGTASPITVNGVDGAVQAFRCTYDTAKLGLSNCAATVALTVPALGGTVTGTIDSTNVSSITMAGRREIALNNGYRLLVDTASVSAPANKTLGVIVTAKSATLRGGLLGNGGVTINGFGIARGALCGQVLPFALSSTGPFQLTNVQVAPVSVNCPNGIPQPVDPKTTSDALAAVKLSVTTDAKLAYLEQSESHPGFGSIDLTLRGLGLVIPFNGGRIDVKKPSSMTLAGNLFGRKVVGICPAVLQPAAAAASQPAGTSSNGATTAVGMLPVVVAGVPTVSSSDIKHDEDQVFRVLDDGTYAVCAGLHLTPGDQVSTPSDLVNAQLIFGLDSPDAVANAAPDNAPRVKLHAARVSYAGNALTTKLGTRSVTIKSLDLSYTSVPSEMRHNAYAELNKIPIACTASLSGDMTVTLQGLSNIGNSDSLLNTQLGIGRSCMFADVYGSVTIPITANSSMILKELHFATGPRVRKSSEDRSGPDTAWYSKVNVEINAGQGGIALHDTGIEDYDGNLRVSGGPDYGRTAQMNAGWIVNGLIGLVTGLVIHKL